MVFVILGTQKNAFTRMLNMVEALIDSGLIDEPVIAQIGYTNFASKKMECVKMVDENTFQQYIQDSSVIITHSGSGALFSSIKKGKKIIAVARLAKYGEMIDDHQLELVSKLTQEGYILDGTNSIVEAWKQIKSFVPRPFDFTNTICQEIENWIELTLNR